MSTDPDFGHQRRSEDRHRRNRLVEEHLDLARGFARRYRNRGVAIDDLEQVARLGLIAAAERFEPHRNIRFETFAARTIDGELKRHFRDKTWDVRVPRRQQELVLATRTAIDRLTAHLVRPPTAQEVADDLQVALDDVLAGMEATHAYQADSLDQPPPSLPPGDSPSFNLGDSLATADNETDRFEQQQLVTQLLTLLPERERQVVTRRYFEDKSQRAIADELGISQMHVSRILRRALISLRQTIPDW